MVSLSEVLDEPADYVGIAATALLTAAKLAGSEMPQRLLVHLVHDSRTASACSPAAPDRVSRPEPQRLDPVAPRTERVRAGGVDGALLAPRRRSRSLTDVDQRIVFGRIGDVGGRVIGVGFFGTIGFGLWLSFSKGDYAPWDGWIAAAIILWVIAGATGGRAEPSTRRSSSAHRS